MAGALIGLAAGTALSYAGAQHRERLEREQAGEHFMKESFIKNVHEHPEALMNGGLDPQGKSLFGKDWENIKAPMMPAAAEAARQKDFQDRVQQAAQQRIATLLGIPPGAFGAPGAGQQQPPTTAPSPGATPLGAPPSGMRGGTPLSAGPPPPAGGVGTQDISAKGAATPPPPQVPPAASPPVPGPPQAPGTASAAPAPQAADSTAVGAPTLGGTGNVAIDLAEAYTVMGDTKSAEQWTKIADLQSKQNLTPDQILNLGMQQKRLDLEAKNIAQTGSLRDATLALTAAQQRSTNEFHTAMLGMRKSEDYNRNVAAFDTLRSNLSTQLAAIAAAQQKGLPPDTIKTQLDRWNSRLKSAKSRADALQIPYDKKEFEPLQQGEIASRLQAYSAGILGSPTLTLEPEDSSGKESSAPVGDSSSTPPVPGAIRGTYKGKPGWRDPHDPTAFYPD